MPAILASLVLDAADQSIFQMFTDDPLPGYQTYDKALDVYYLAVAYTSTMRNWRDPVAFRTARFLYLYRLVGVALFELFDARWLLLVFPNTFEYFFIVYEFVRTRWNPLRLGAVAIVAIAAFIWIFIKLPQEWWIHIAKLDFTDFMADYPWMWGVLGGLAVAVAIAVYANRRRIPAPDWPFTVDVDRHLVLPAVPAEPEPFWSAVLVEKVVLLALISVIFAQVLPDIRASNIGIAVGVTVLVIANAAVSQWLRRRGHSWANTAQQFGAMLLINVAIVAVDALIGRRTAVRPRRRTPCSSFSCSRCSSPSTTDSEPRATRRSTARPCGPPCVPNSIGAPCPADHAARPSGAAATSMVSCAASGSGLTGDGHEQDHRRRSRRGQQPAGGVHAETVGDGAEHQGQRKERQPRRGAHAGCDAGAHGRRDAVVEQAGGEHADRNGERGQHDLGDGDDDDVPADEQGRGGRSEQPGHHGAGQRTVEAHAGRDAHPEAERRHQQRPRRPVEARARIELDQPQRAELEDGLAEQRRDDEQGDDRQQAGLGAHRVDRVADVAAERRRVAALVQSRLAEGQQAEGGHDDQRHGGEVRGTGGRGAGQHSTGQSTEHERCARRDAQAAEHGLERVAGPRLLEHGVVDDSVQRSRLHGEVDAEQQRRDEVAGDAGAQPADQPRWPAGRGCR